MVSRREPSINDVASAEHDRRFRGPRSSNSHCSSPWLRGRRPAASGHSCWIRTLIRFFVKHQSAFKSRWSSSPDPLARAAAADHPGTTGVLCVGMFARTDRSIFRWARTSSYGVNASHCRSETSENLGDFQTSR